MEKDTWLISPTPTPECLPGQLRRTEGSRLPEPGRRATTGCQKVASFHYFFSIKINKFIGNGDSFILLLNFSKGEGGWLFIFASRRRQPILLPGKDLLPKPFVQLNAWGVNRERRQAQRGCLSPPNSHVAQAGGGSWGNNPLPPAAFDFIESTLIALSVITAIMFSPVYMIITNA